jgi:hypothetical protein
MTKHRYTLITYFTYLAQQAGGLTDLMFSQNLGKVTEHEIGLQ